jgi:hypothetical protein
VLAGYTGLPNDFELDADLRRAAKELGYSSDDPEQWLADHARGIARDLLAGRRRPKDCAEELKQLATASQRDDLLPWIGIAEDFDAADVSGIDLRALVRTAQDEARRLVADEVP